MDEQVDLQGLDEGARALVQRLLADIKHKQAQIDKLAYEMALLKRLKFAAKTEALNTDQRNLLEDDLEEDLQAIHEEVEQLKSEAERAPRQQPKRQSLPAQLPRQEFKHEPEVTECCNEPMRRIGEDVAEKLDYTPGVFSLARMWSHAHDQAAFKGMAGKTGPEVQLCQRIAQADQSLKNLYPQLLDLC